jgi:hypothetical protein
MKKLILVVFSILLIGCGDEKAQYQEHVFKLMKGDQDLVDYSLDPEEMSRCVVDVSGKKMPGPFSWDPRRASVYKAYTKIVKFKLNIGNFSEQLFTMDEVTPKLTMDSLIREFGSARAMVDAHRNFSESVLTCFESLTFKSNKF